jgi:hypothetical protein
MRTWTAAVLLLLIGGPALTAPSLQPQAVKRHTPSLDGEVMKDPAWVGAPVAGGFALLGKAGVLASQGTQVRVLYDDACLYVSFVCAEAQMDKVATAVKDAAGPVWEDDCVEVFVSPYADPARYYHFLVNAAGVLRDELGQDNAWSSGARAAVRPGKGEWSVELAIPFHDLALDESVGPTWRANFARNERPSGEVSSWAPCASQFHEPASFGELAGLSADFGPAIADSLRARATALQAGLLEIERAARAYENLDLGRGLMGATSQLETQVDTILLGLKGKPTLARVKALGKGLSEAEAELPPLRGRLAKLPLLKAAGRAGYAVCRESTMTKVRPDQPYAGEVAHAVQLRLARNEYEAAQLVVVPVQETLRDVAVTVSDLKGPKRSLLPAAEITINPVGYVEVRKPTSNSPLGAGLIPDPLLPYEKVDVDRSRVQSWWVTVHATTAALPGTYRGTITVQPKNAPATVVPFQVQVWSFSLPVTSRLRSSYGMGLSWILPRYDVAQAPGVPPGWFQGLWVGADIEGRPNYYGSLTYDLAFDTQTRKSGKRSCRVHVTDVQPGAFESPRVAYVTEELPLEPKTDYEFSVWYRTAPEDTGGPGGYFAAAGGTEWPATGGEWREGTYRFNSGDGKGVRVYLRVDKVGTVWFDRTRLAPAGAGPEVNLLPNPDFEQGEEGGVERIRDTYYADALRHRLSPTETLAPKVSFSDDGTLSMDWTEFDQKMGQYVAAGLSAFNVSWCQLPSGWGSVETVQDEARIGRARELLQQTQAHLDKKGWTHLAYIYTIDEPGAAAFPQVKQAFELAHQAAPKLKTLLTYGYGASKPIEPGAPRYADLAGYVDIHVPHSDCYEPIYLKKRQAAGDEIWDYVCISAQRPWLNNWAIDYPGTDHRLMFWQLFSHDITGFLYWQATYWQVDPWKDTATYPGGNGDGSLLYPGKDGPVDSIRWDLCRDGTEDYDMLVMLRDAVAAQRAAGASPAAEALLSFPELTTSWTEYTQDPKLIEQHRLRAGNRLDELTRKLSRR